MERSNHYRAAVCLNNYGASLLERGQYRQAALVLRDSLTIMNSVLSEEQQEEQQLAASTVAEKLHFANKCMVDSQSKSSLSSSQHKKQQRSRTTTPQQGLEFHLFRYDGVASVPLEEEHNNTTGVQQQQQQCAIVIDDFDAATRESQTTHVLADMDIHTAIIVYNTAMSRLALVHSQQQQTVSASLRKPQPQQQRNPAQVAAHVSKACVKLLRYAHAILSKRAMKCRPREATLVSVLVLGKLVTLLHSQQPSQQQQYDHDIMEERVAASKAHAQLKSAFAAYENIVPSRPDLAAAA